MEVDEGKWTSSNEIYGLFGLKRELWIGTDGGICYYDGISIHKFSNEFQTSNSNAHILEDSRGRIWFKNFNGQFFYVENDTIHSFDIPDDVRVDPYVEFDFIGDTIILLSNKVFKFHEKDSSLIELKGFDLGITSYDYDMNDHGDFLLSSLEYLYRLKTDSFEVVKRLGLRFEQNHFVVF